MPRSVPGEPIEPPPRRAIAMTHEVIDETGRTLAVASPAYESIAGRPESIPASGATARGLDEHDAAAGR